MTNIPPGSSFAEKILAEADGPIAPRTNVVHRASSTIPRKDNEAMPSVRDVDPTQVKTHLEVREPARIVGRGDQNFDEPAANAKIAQALGVYRSTGQGELTQLPTTRAVGAAESGIEDASREGRSEPGDTTHLSEDDQRAIKDPVTGRFAKEFLDTGSLSEASVRDAAKTMLPHIPPADAQRMVKAYVEGEKVKRASAGPSAQEQLLQQANETLIFREFSRDYAGWQKFAAWTHHNLTADQRTSIENAVANAYSDPATARATVGRYWRAYADTTGGAAR